MVLFLFGTMLTRSKIGRQGDLNYKHWYVGAFVGLLLLGTLVYVLLRHVRQGRAAHGMRCPLPRQQVSDVIFGPYLIPFWGLSFVLLAAIIGAIVLARRD